MPVKTLGHTLLQGKRIGIFRTDLHAYGGKQAYFEYPRILGRELSAMVRETGSSQGSTAGKAVTGTAFNRFIFLN